MRESETVSKRGRPKKAYKTAVIRIHDKLKQLLENDAEGQHCDIADLASVVLARAYRRLDIIKQIERRSKSQ